MAARRKIGLIYEYNENWIGGTYYIQNLISALNYLPEYKKPFVVVFAAQNDFNELMNSINYLYIERRETFRKLNVLLRIVNVVYRKIFNKNLINIFHNDIKIIFPATNQHHYLRQKGLSLLYWIPDFQVYHFKGFFENDESLKIKNFHSDIVTNGRYILLSSIAAREDFNKFYPHNKLEQFVLPFAVTHPDFQEELKGILEKYQMPKKYFICCNQFWKHKNHIIVLKAVTILKKRGIEVVVAFTGKERDTQSSNNYEEIKKLIEEYDINDSIRLLGFISRKDQLSLLKKAIAVIQPSLFEGWSTVIEDAKSLNTNIIASNINVNKEQLQSYTGKTFFSALDEIQLADCMDNYITTSAIINYDYEDNIYKYANTFIDILNQVEIHTIEK
jgi:glycosyltransferase involved in cell wall biosynthesis